MRPAQEDPTALEGRPFVHFVRQANTRARGLAFAQTAPTVSVFLRAHTHVQPVQTDSSPLRLRRSVSLVDANPAPTRSEVNATFAQQAPISLILPSMDHLCPAQEVLIRATRVLPHATLRLLAPTQHLVRRLTPSAPLDLCPTPKPLLVPFALQAHMRAPLLGLLLAYHAL